MPFAFYDLETTGTEPAFDQPLQFAAILTDDELNEIERVNLRCRLAPHILPGPYAMIVTGLTPEEATDSALPSYLEFAQQIRSLIHKWAPATWVGYNTIKFDEPFLRQMFYQTLQPDLYETQFNGNDRLDIMLAVQAVWVYERSILTWPEDDLHQPILKLDRLAPANGFEHHDAHDALGDVEATIHIARHIRDRAPQLWSDILANRNKHDVAQRLQRFEPIDIVLRYKGPPRICTGCLCGFSEANPNSAGFFDLHLGEPADFVDAGDDVIAQAISGSRKIIRSVSINNVPNLFQTYSHNPELFEKASLIGSRPDFQKRVARALAARFEGREPDEKRPVETRIYEGFYSGADKALLRDFQSSDWPQRSEIVQQLQDPRLQQLGRRMIAFQGSVPPDQATQEAALSYLKEKWQTPAGEKPKWTSFETAEKDLSEIEAAGLAPAEVVAHWRAFYAERKERLATGRLI